MYEIRDQDQERQERRWDWIDPRRTVEMSEGEVQDLREWMEREALGTLRTSFAE